MDPKAICYFPAQLLILRLLPYQLLCSSCGHPRPGRPNSPTCCSSSCHHSLHPAPPHWRPSQPSCCVETPCQRSCRSSEEGGGCSFSCCRDICHRAACWEAWLCRQGTSIPPHDQVPAASMNQTPVNSDDFLALDLSSLSQHREKLTWTQEFFCMHSLTSNNLLFCVHSAVSQRFQLQLAAGRGRGTAQRHSPLGSTSYGGQGVLGGGRC